MAATIHECTTISEVCRHTRDGGRKGVWGETIYNAKGERREGEKEWQGGREKERRGRAKEGEGEKGHMR